MEDELAKIKNDLKDVEHLIQRSTIIESKDHSKISYYVVDSDIVLNLQNILYNLQLCLFSKEGKHKIEQIDQNDLDWIYLYTKKEMVEEIKHNVELLRRKVNEIVYELNKGDVK